MEVTTVVVGDLAVNCYIVSKGNDAILIDPGDDAEIIKKALGSKKVHAVLLTHGHFDHTGAVKEFQNEGARVIVSDEDAKMLKDSYTSLAAPFGFPFNLIISDETVNDGDVLEFFNTSFKVIATPGHTAGSVCYLCGDLLFSGDTLFMSSIGRTDFPGGSFQVIEKSIKEKIYSLNGDITVYPGHGGTTTVKNERLSNPFVR
jgi:glyoxylase-like metal-dependent hydrolase (beta-lactamase superfamily II)